MLNKSLDEVDFNDLEELKENNIPESAVMEYKQDKIRDKKLIKEICGMANNQGGHIIFGIKEEDEIEPPGPEELAGVDLEEMKIQRLEQVINTNIEPRILVNIEKVENKENNNYFVVIRVPEGSEKPYISKKEDRFYMRYNTESRRMTEPEISNMYKERFSEPTQIIEYLKNTTEYHHQYVKAMPKIKIEDPVIFGHIYIFPTSLYRRRIGTIDSETLEQSPHDVIYEYTKGYANSFPTKRSYTKYGIGFFTRYEPQKLEIHRNGLVHHVDEYGDKENRDINFMRENFFAEHLIRTIHYADWVYNQLKYFGPVTIKIHVFGVKNIYPASILKGFIRENYSSFSEAIEIEREFSSWNLTNDWFSKVKNIMDEFMNYFGLPSFFYMENGGDLYELYKSENKE